MSPELPPMIVQYSGHVSLSVSLNDHQGVLMWIGQEYTDRYLK